MKRFNRAVEIARSLTSAKKTGRCFHVTLVYDKSKIISIGHNNYDKTHPRAMLHKKIEASPEYIPCIHSELSAIIKLGDEDCSKYTFVNVRIDNDGKINNARPCTGCASLLEQVGYKRLYYTNSTGEFSLWE